MGRSRPPACIIAPTSIFFLSDADSHRVWTSLSRVQVTSWEALALMRRPSSKVSTSTQHSLPGTQSYQRAGWRAGDCASSEALLNCNTTLRHIMQVDFIVYGKVWHSIASYCKVRQWQRMAQVLQGKAMKSNGKVWYSISRYFKILQGAAK